MTKTKNKNRTLNKYALKRLYHMHLDCFNPYKDLCSLIEYMLWFFKLFVLGIWNPFGIFTNISLFKNPYKYAVMTFMRHISTLSETAKLI